MAFLSVMTSAAPLPLSRNGFSSLIVSAGGSVVVSIKTLSGVRISASSGSLSTLVLGNGLLNASDGIELGLREEGFHGLFVAGAVAVVLGIEVGMMKEEEQHAFISRVDLLLRFYFSFDQLVLAVWFVSASLSLRWMCGY